MTITQSHTPGWPHQVEAVNFAMSMLKSVGGALLQHGVGCGKTRTALSIARHLECKRIVVITQLSVLGSWRDQVTKWWPLAGITILRDDERIPQGGDLPEVIIVNYDRLTSKFPNYTEVTVAHALYLWYPDMVILDESQYVKSYNSQRTKAVQHILGDHYRPAPYRLLLSATPADSPLDWWSQMNMIAPHDPLWGKNFYAYKTKLEVMKTLPSGQNIPVGFRPERVEEAKKALAPYVHVVPREVLKLPEPIWAPLPVRLEPEEYQFYRSAEKDFLLGMEDDKDVKRLSAVNRFGKLIQLASGFYYHEDGEPRVTGTAKLTAVRDLIEQAPALPTIIGYTHTVLGVELAALFDEMKINHHYIDGRTLTASRSGFIEQFQRGRLDHILVQYDAGSVGIDLSRAERIILLTPVLSYITYEQFIGRAQRPGRQGPLLITPVIADDTIDRAVFDMVFQKKKAVTLWEDDDEDLLPEVRARH